MRFISMSIQGAVLITVIIVLRALLLNRLPKKTFVFLWFVALVRLCLPFSVPSPLSVYSLFGTGNTPDFIQEQKEPIQEPEEPVSDARFWQILSAPRITDAPAGTEENGASAAVQTSLAADRAGVRRILTGVWVAGAVVCAFAFAYSYLRCLRELRTSLPVENPLIAKWLQKHKIRRGICVRQSDRFATPLTYGILHPIILLPKSTRWEEAKTVEYVLLHEYVHIRRFDSVVKLLLILTAVLHWFNPMVWAMFILANRDLELSCDEAVIRYFGKSAGGKDARAGYAYALISFEETRNGHSPLCSGFCKNAMGERIIAIMKYKKTTFFTLTMAALLVVGTATVFATSAAETSKKSSLEEEDRTFNVANMTEQEKTMMAYTDPVNGKTYYSTDGGRTFASMTDEEFDAAYPSPEVEWWSYEEYKAWLENEKKELQSMLGEKGRTGGRGEFVWTQEMIDETIALYEEILEDIGNGVLVSKSVSGSEDIMVYVNPADIIRNNTESVIKDAVSETEEVLGRYVPFGLSYEINPVTGSLSMNWQNKPVHSLYDSENGEWIANSLNGFYLGSDAVDLETVYENGTLVALRECQVQCPAHHKEYEYHEEYEHHEEYNHHGYQTHHEGHHGY